MVPSQVSAVSISLLSSRLLLGRHKQPKLNMSQSKHSDVPIYFSLFISCNSEWHHQPINQVKNWEVILDFLPICLFFWCGPFLKSLLNLLQYCFCFMFWFFGREGCGILAPRQGIEPIPPALKGEVLTTGPPGKSLSPSVLTQALVNYLLPILLHFAVSSFAVHGTSTVSCRFHLLSCILAFAHAVSSTWSTLPPCL